MDFSSYLKLLGLTLLPVAAGIALGRVGVPRRGSKYLFSIALFGCQTVIVVIAVWAARLSGSAFVLPFITLAAWFATAFVARLASGAMGHRPKERGAFICAMCLSNHGYTLLGIVALILFGQEGLSQATYAQLFIVPFLVLFCFPLGRFYGRGEGRTPFAEILKRSILDPRSVPVVAMAAGLALNFSGVERPAWCASVLPYLVYVGTISSGLAVGLLYRGMSLRRFWRENVFSFVYRLSFYPLMYAGMALVFGLGGLDMRILILFGLVPPALFSNLVADFFDLDADLTNSVFIAGTVLFLLAVLPIYALTAMP